MTPEDRNRVLAACGYFPTGDTPCGWMRESGVIQSIGTPEPTQQEAWETLCRMCKETMYHPRLEGLARVLLETFNAHIHGVDPVSFITEQYGSLTAAIEEAILWVLDRKGGGE